MSSRRRRVGILWRGDEAARHSASPETSRFKAMFAALAAVGVDAKPIVYEEDVLASNWRKNLMRSIVIAAVLLGSSCLYPSFAQNETKSPSAAQPQTTPVQPERTPQQSEQSREQDRKSAEDVQIGRGWRAQERDRMGQNDERRMGNQIGREMDPDDRTVGRNWRMRPDDDRDGRDGRSHYDEDRSYRHDEDRSYRRVKVCIEYENGDEYCHYRD